MAWGVALLLPVISDAHHPRLINTFKSASSSKPAVVVFTSPAKTAQEVNHDPGGL
jgi:hypothetical protein